MTAVEALRRARITMDCMGDGLPGCPMTEHANDRSHPGIYPWADSLGAMPSEVHDACASALLDGFSVDEVTAAEHTTEEPHE